tara:strand:+ start:1589 stop:2803 length:1215 start_codon:yes stop_codon:yes gene_type:complete
VTTNNLEIKNFFLNNHINKSVKDQSLRRFNKTLNEIINDFDNSKKIYNILNNNYKFNFNLGKLQKFKKFKNIVIIGMGGSILGTEAIYEFLKKKIKKNIFFLDDINYEKLSKVKKLNLNKTLFLIISKSGNTIETLANVLSLNIIKRKKNNIVIITEKKNNILYSLTQKYKLFFIEHKNFIGGRYSVLSEVGAVPALLMGINFNSLRKNIKKYLLGNRKKFLKESLINLSSLLNKGKYSNLIFLNYSPKLEKFLFWCQQLIAESLGKKGKGFLPVVSNNPKDHHSLLQLYLDGPRDKLFYVFSLKDELNIRLKTHKIAKELNFINNKSLKAIKLAQKNAVVKVLKTKKIPLREFTINNVNEETLGELFSYFILETSILGKMLKINPFDQPAVEQVKIITKKNIS